jgi:hypothetical protein
MSGMDDALKNRSFALQLELLEPATRASVARLSVLRDAAFVQIGASGRCFDRPALRQALPAEAGAVRYRAFDLQACPPAPELAPALSPRAPRWRRRMAHAVPPRRADVRQRLSMVPWERQRSL